MKAVKARVTKALNVGSYINCVTGNTPVLLNDHVSDIKEIKPGMQVITSKSSKVFETYKRVYKGDIVTIKPRGLPEVEFTPEHPILIVKIKKYKPHKGRRYIKIGNPVWCAAENIDKNCAVAIPRIKKVENFILKFRKGHKYENVEVVGDKKLFELFGWYLTEGSTSKTFITFSLGKGEKKHVNTLKNLIEEKLGLPVHLYERKTAYQLVICNKDLTQFFKSSFGNIAVDKKIPPFVFFAKKEYIISFLKTFLQGDGHIAPYDLRFFTSSRNVAFQLLFLLAKIGIRGCIYKRERKKAHLIEGREIKGSSLFEVRVRGKQAKILFELPKKRKYFRNIPMDKDFVYHEIDNIKRKRTKVEVFNLETENGIYCVPFIVHNCADNTGAKLLQIISVFGYKGRKRRLAKAGVGDKIKVSVREGDVKMRKQIVNAVVIRQKAEYRRANGMRIAFEDNAAVIVDEKGNPKGTQIKGPVAKEVVERYLSIGKIANIVV